MAAFICMSHRLHRVLQSKEHFEGELNITKHIARAKEFNPNIQKK